MHENRHAVGNLNVSDLDKCSSWLRRGRPTVIRVQPRDDDQAWNPSGFVIENDVNAPMGLRLMIVHRILARFRQVPAHTKTDRRRSDLSSLVLFKRDEHGHRHRYRNTSPFFVNMAGDYVI